MRHGRMHLHIPNPRNAMRLFLVAGVLTVFTYSASHGQPGFFDQTIESGDSAQAPDEAAPTASGQWLSELRNEKPTPVTRIALDHRDGMEVAGIELAESADRRDWFQKAIDAGNEETGQRPKGRARKGPRSDQWLSNLKLPAPKAENPANSILGQPITTPSLPELVPLPAQEATAQEATAQEPARTESEPADLLEDFSDGSWLEKLNQAVEEMPEPETVYTDKPESVKIVFVEIPERQDWFQMAIDNSNRALAEEAVKVKSGGSQSADWVTSLHEKAEVSERPEATIFDPVAKGAKAP
jgi:hypothetical protein